MTRFFVVSFVHHDQDQWRQLLHPHLAYLRQQVDAGTVAATGPREHPVHRAGLLVVRAADESGVIELLRGDPFWAANLFNELVIFPWTPFLGAFAAEAEPVSFPDSPPAHDRAG